MHYNIPHLPSQNLSSFFIPVIFLSVNGTRFGIYGCLRLLILPNFDLSTVCIKNWRFSIYASFCQFKPVSASFCQFLPPGWELLFLPAEITTLNNTDLQAGRGRVYESRQMGVYIEQRKNRRSGEHWILTRGQNWWTSRPAWSRKVMVEATV